MSELNSDLSSFHNLDLYEYFTMDHNNKMIYLYQITVLDLSNHPFVMSAVKEVMTKFYFLCEITFINFLLGIKLKTNIAKKNQSLKYWHRHQN